jgi:uncharacterized membrane protein (DUF485 family)
VRGACRVAGERLTSCQQSPFVRAPKGSHVPEPPLPSDDRTSAAPDARFDVLASRNARYGIVLFLLYLILYGGFVGLSAFAPTVLERPALAGVNLAIVYGMGLIVAALALALLYGWLCRGQGDSHATGASPPDQEAGA